MSTYCGYIAIVGRPNVGKSTLLNRILNQKISITSKKAQTTRHRILGILTEKENQFIFVDTPGVHQKEKKAINRMMNKTALSTLHDVDAVIFVIDAMTWTDEDALVLSKLKETNLPCILVVNKVDTLKDKNALLPYLEKKAREHTFDAIISLSAKTGAQVHQLKESITPFLQESPHFFPEDYSSDRPARFMCAELIREKVFRLCGQELPYSVSVEIESFKEEKKLTRIHALIWVDKESHKRMIIGEKGDKLKKIATHARIEMEQLLGKKVFLQCWCKVKSGWLDNDRLLKQFGYDQ